MSVSFARMAKRTSFQRQYRDLFGEDLPLRSQPRAGYFRLSLFERIAMASALSVIIILGTLFLIAFLYTCGVFIWAFFTAPPLFPDLPSG